MPELPAFVSSDDGREFWEEFGPAVNALGLLESLDSPAFAILAESFATLKDLRREWDSDQRFTITVGDNGAEQPNPLLDQIGKQVKGILQLLAEFGMTPVSRQKLTGSTSATPIDPNADPMAALANEANELGSIPKPPDAPD